MKKDETSLDLISGKSWRGKLQLVFTGKLRHKLCPNPNSVSQSVRKSVQSLSRVQLFVTPWITGRQASLSITNSRSLLKPMSIKSVIHPTISFSVIPLFFCPQSIPASRSFPTSQLFAWGGQSTGVSASASVLPVIIQDWSPLGWTGCFSLQSKGLAGVFSKTAVQKHQFWGAQLSSQSNSHIHTWPLEKP